MHLYEETPWARGRCGLPAIAEKEFCVESQHQRQGRATANAADEHRRKAGDRMFPVSMCPLVPVCPLWVD